jgi:hypothetical protein
MVYLPLRLKTIETREPLLLSLPPLFSLSKKKLLELINTLPSLPVARFSPRSPSPSHRPIALRSPHRGGRSLRPSAPRAIPCGEAPAGQLPSPLRRSDRVLPEVTICEFPAFHEAFSQPRFARARLPWVAAKVSFAYGSHPCASVA